MQEFYTLQSQYCSDVDIKKICSFDYELIEKPTNFIYHQSPRFILIKKGSGKFMVDTELYDIKKDTLLSILPWDCTKVVEVYEPLQYEIVKYNYDVVASMLRAVTYDELEKMPILKKLDISPVIELGKRDKDEVENIFTILKNELGVESALEKLGKESYFEIYASSLISQLIIIFCRGIDKTRVFPKVMAKPGDQRALILRYIYLHLNEKLTLEKLAKQFFMSKASISRYIFDRTGLSFNALVNEMRITKTTNYLLYTELTLEELAPILGYVDAAHISKMFSARMEEKIVSYRQAHGKALHAGHISENKQDYKIIEYITKNFSEDLKAGSVAEKFNISVIELNKAVKSQVTKSFYDFLNFLRINKACELLLESELDITEIAIEVGYNTVKTFRRNFVEQRHITPAKFREMVVME
ncbi:MAG: AraC family transcriptional regulator [Eubacteriales bacterium]